MLHTRPAGPFLLPDFSRITALQWEAFLEEAEAAADSALQQAAVDPQLPTFENTFLAIERFNAAFAAAYNAFFVAKEPHVTEPLAEVASRWVERSADLKSRIYQNEDLFERCRAVSAAWVDAPETERRLMDAHLREFESAGMALPPVERQQLAAIKAELAGLGERFATACREAAAVEVYLTEASAQGLSEDEQAQAKARAAAAGQAGLGFLLQPEVVEALVAKMTDRASREALWTACAARGTGERDTDTRPLITRILELRAERARLLGFPTPARQLMANTMAKEPGAAMGLVLDTWNKAQGSLLRDLGQLKELASTDGIDDLRPWDVPFYAEQWRRTHFDLDSEEVRAYLPLSAVRDGAFATASRLFGLSFEPVAADLYHPDAKAFVVKDSCAQNRVLGLFIVDDVTRPTKNAGAWMDNLRPPHGLEEPVAPWVINVCNFEAPSEGSPILLDMDDALTVFHEFGHALHSLLSTARYPSQAGTNVVRDFVELPSQIFENWLRDPETLKKTARHWKTGAPIPDGLVERIQQASQFGQSLKFSRYLASAFLDLALHGLESPHEVDMEDFEAQALAQLAVPDGIAPRHRYFHFAHLFSDDHYAAGYYSYLWAEVLDADAFTRFKETGLFDQALGQKLRECIYAPGGSRDPAALFEDFMGRAPSADALLARHGLTEVSRPRRKMR